MYKEQGKNSFPVDRMIQKDNRLLRAVKTTAKTTDWMYIDWFIEKETGTLSSRMFNGFITIAQEQLKKDPEQRTFNTTVKDIANISGFKDTHYKQVVEAIKLFATSSIRLETENEINPILIFDNLVIPKKETIKGKPTVLTYRFSSSFFSFVGGLTENYTILSMLTLAKLISKGANALYQWIKQYPKAIEGGEVFIEEKRLRMLTGTLDKYKYFSEFKRKVIDPAVKEINKESDLTISYLRSKKNKVTKEKTILFSTKFKNKAEPLEYLLPESIENENEFNDYFNALYDLRGFRTTRDKEKRALKEYFNNPDHIASNDLYERARLYVEEQKKRGNVYKTALRTWIEEKRFENYKGAIAKDTEQQEQLQKRKTLIEQQQKNGNDPLVDELLANMNE